MHIAFLIPNMMSGGAERVVLALAKGLLSRGWEVDIVLQRKVGGPLLQLIPDGARLVDLKTARIRNLPFTLRGFLKDSQPDVVVASLWPLTIAAVLAAFGMRRRPGLVLVDHNNLPQQYGGSLWLRLTTRLFYPLADRCVGVSNGVAKTIARLARISQRKCRAIPNPVSPLPGKEPSAQEADALWKGRKGPRFITVGSFKPQKNHALLLRAFAQVAGQRPDATLLLLGTGELLEPTRQLATDLGLAESTIFPGFALDPSPYFRSADTFVLSSDYEGFGLVLVEAMHAELAIVSTDCEDGPAEVLEGGRYGALVPVGDEAALAQAMLAAIDSPLRGEAVRERARAFMPEHAVEAHAELIEEVMAERGR